jgi:hypothetical protein
MIDPAGRCSAASARVGEPVAGSAPRARAWLVLEQPGPYGFSATTESHLPEAVRASLGALPKDSGTTVLLARAVGHHADVPGEVHAARRFWFAHVAPGAVAMRTGLLDDTELLRPDLADVVARAAEGELPTWGEVSDELLMLVCTNSRRDVCCALEGRPLAAALAADPESTPYVLETSHLGGHRFAPTALLLPTGHAFGRLDPGSAREVLAAAAHGRLAAVDRHRGRTALAQPLQVAEDAVRRVTGVDGLDDLEVLGVDDGLAAPVGLRWSGSDAEVRHRDGRRWRVPVRLEPLPEPRNESCGKASIDAQVWVAGPPVAQDRSGA